MRIEGVAGSEIILIGLGYSVAICLQTMILLFYAVRTFSIPMQWLLPNVSRSILAVVVGSLSAYATLNFFVEGINEASFLGILLQGLLGGVVGIAGTILTYYLLHSPELKEIYNSFHRKIFKTDVVAPQEDVL
jgi:hypothetical protein